MDYRTSLDYLFGLQQFGVKLGLDNIRTLLIRLGSPERQFACVHVAGTNGKGSTSAALADILQAAGYRVGLYTSPHLHSFTERIQVDRQPVSEAAVAELAELLRTAADVLPVTFFELTTAMALEHFRRCGVEIAILETGLGGRLDATNSVTPVLSVITPISLDHQAYLGDSLQAVAMEKAGIIKPGVSVCLGPQLPEVLTVLETVARQAGAACIAAGRDWTVRPVQGGCIFTGLGVEVALRPDLPGEHQHHNLGLALAAGLILQRQGWRVDPAEAVQALDAVRWPGRLEWWPSLERVLLDAAHNPAGSEALARYLEQGGIKPIRLVTGFKADKDWRTMLAPLLPLASHVYVTEPDVEAAVPPAEISAFLASAGAAARVCLPAASAFEAAVAERRPGEAVVVAGSIFLVSAVRGHLLERDHDS